MLETIRNDLKKKYPPDICDALVNSYKEIREQYYLGKHEPAELNGGKFVEACLRLIQCELTGSYVPISNHIPNIPKVLSDLENTQKTKNETFRIHIPRALTSIYNIRNRRGVGHLGGDINPNLSDSTLILTIADWVLTELYRTVYAVPLDEAQGIINDLVRRKMLLVHQIGDIKRVLAPTLPVRDQVLLLLHSSEPQSMTEETLLSSIEYENKSYFRNGILKNLHRDRLIEYSPTGECYILPPGMRYVDENYNTWIERINGGD